MSLPAPSSLPWHDATLERALARFGANDALPYSEIMRAVVRYEPRPKSRR